MYFLFGFLMWFVLQWVDPTIPWWVAILATMGAGYVIANITHALRSQ